MSQSPDPNVRGPAGEITPDFRSLFDASPAAFLVLTPADFRIIAVNDACVRTMRRERDRLLGSTVLEVFADDSPSSAGELRRLLEDLPGKRIVSGVAMEQELEGMGRRVLLLDARFDRTGLILLGVRDITDQHRSAEELHRLTETLEEQVAERTREVRELSKTLTIAEQEERQRISTLLHDDLQQLLYGIQMKVALAHDRAERSDLEGVRTQTARTMALLDQAIARTRQLTVDLTPPILEGEGLVDALGWLRTQMRDLHDLQVVIRDTGDIDDEPPDLRILLFQAVRELLFNVAKHAGTGRAEVEVSAVGGEIRIVVADQGRGFDPEAVERQVGIRGGLGLFSVRERLRLRGGRLVIDSAPGMGTRMEVYAPLSASS